MTRLTEAKWREALATTKSLGDFVEAIAALAVQEVERGVDPTYKTAFLAEAKRVDRLHAEVATLTAQLATAKREEQERIIAEVKDLRTIYTNKPYSDFSQGWHEACDAMLRKFPPAINPVSGSTCKPDCCLPNYCAPGKGCHATPSGEGVKREVLLQEIGRYAAEAAATGNLAPDSALIAAVDAVAPATPLSAPKLQHCEMFAFHGKECSAQCASCLEFAAEAASVRPATASGVEYVDVRVRVVDNDAALGTYCEVARITPADAKRIVAMAQGTE